MRVGGFAGVLVCLGLSGCQNGFDITGQTLEGYDTFGRRGGALHSPDGNFMLEVDRGTLAHEIDLTIGVLDDCVRGEIACYEVGPEGLILSREATVTLDISRLVEAGYGKEAAPLSIYVQDRGPWRVAKSTDTDADTVSIGLTTLGPVSIVPGAGS